MTLIGDQRFIRTGEKIHKMRQARVDYAPACMEDIESIERRYL